MTPGHDKAPVRTEAPIALTAQSNTAVTGIARVSQKDRTFFARHPERREYLRPAIPGEFGPFEVDAKVDLVRVVQAAPGIRRKSLFRGAGAGGVR